MKRDFLTILDLNESEITGILNLALKLKEQAKKDKLNPLLSGKILGMIFHKPSLRTRVSFESGMLRLGGNAINLTKQEVGWGDRESLKDMASVLGRYLDIIMVRTYEHNKLEEFAKHCPVPVINGLTDMFHPCQIMADLLTIKEEFGRIEGIKVCYIGDGNNICNSWINAAYSLGFELKIATPENYEPDIEVFNRAKSKINEKIQLLNDPEEAVVNADVVYTDTWVSMGKEEEKEKRIQDFKDFQINSKLMKKAKPASIFMHCMPAHIGYEVTEDVFYSQQSRIYEEAENRMHVQEAILIFLLKGIL